MVQCTVKSCKNRSSNTKGSGIQYFRFPKNALCRSEWIRSCGREIENPDNNRICSMHFSKESFIEGHDLKKQLAYPLGSNRILKDSAVPTLNLPVTAVKHAEDFPMSEIPEVISSDAASSRMSFYSDIDSKSTFETQSEREILPSRTSFASTVLEMNLSTSEDNLSESHTRSSSRLSHLTEAGESESSNEYWKEKYIAAQKEIEKLKLDIAKCKADIDHLNKTLAKYFTPGQIKIIKSKKKIAVKWTSEDISSAISLRSISPKAYRYFRNVREFPLPGFSTLRKWVANFSLQPGLLEEVLLIMKYKSPEFTEQNRICVISFDEMYVSHKLSVDKKAEQIIGPHRTVQTVIVRGLFAAWKQVIYYQYDSPMSREVLFNIISKLYDMNYIVAAMVCDLGATNFTLLKSLKIDYTQNSFCHPSDIEKRIFVFNDAPHLIKLVRNNLFDKGFLVNGAWVTKSIFEKVVKLQSNDIKLAHKLTQRHLDMRGNERQKVKFAVQCLSHTVAKAIRWCGENGLLKDMSWAEAHELIELMNQWFDIFNSRSKFSASEHAFGIDIEKQIEVLEKVDNLIKKMKVGSRNKMLPFQKGILLNNKSLQDLYKYLKDKFDINYLLTYRLNQDILENFFSFIRGYGATYDHPSPLEFRYRLKLYILGKHSSVLLSQDTNVSGDLTHTPSITANITEECLTNILAPISDLQEIENIYSIPEEAVIDEDLLKLLENFERNMNIPEITIIEEGLKYIAGYVAHKFRHKYQLYVEEPPSVVGSSWIDCVSRGSLLHPNEKMISIMKAVENAFQTCHGTSLSKDKNIFKKVLEKINLENVPSEVIHTCVRLRTYIRLRQLNKNIEEEDRKRKLKKKYVKF